MILIPNGYLDVPHEAILNLTGVESVQEVATIVSNMAYYGYAPNREVLGALACLSSAELAAWWPGVRDAMAKLKGADRGMDQHIVYRNFPKEVLDMAEGEQLLYQIMIYFGVEYDWVRQPEVVRPPLAEITALKSLALADQDTILGIERSLIAMSNRWSNDQAAWMDAIFVDDVARSENYVVDVDAYGFKENALRMAAQLFKIGGEIKITTATDVLRLAAALSEGDVSLRNRVAFRTFARAERRQLLAMLDQATNIEDDLAMRPEVFKRLLERLRPGDYKFERVKAAYDALYNGRIKSTSSKLDPQTPDPEMLDIAVTRPGEFRRRLHHYFDLFGMVAIDRFIAVMPKLTTRQLVALRAYIATINTRQRLIYPPKANWARAQVADNGKSKLPVEVIEKLDAEIGRLLTTRIATRYPDGVKLDPAVAAVKLQTNDQKLASYGRGTTFDIPHDATFVRSASYWAIGDAQTTWFDNGWNFFDAEWKSTGACAWDDQDYLGAAIMSGDPVNTRDLKGRGCQMIDLYLDKLTALGVRYAVWNVLCFSRKKFSEADEVLATLQWGVDAEKGNVYEPSRAQMVFPLKSDQLSSYVAYVDLVARKLVYMDAPLPASVSSARDNGERLERVMPAYIEYLDALPSLHDLLRDVVAAPNAVPVCYSDADFDGSEPEAYAFLNTNANCAGRRLVITDFSEVE